MAKQKSVKFTGKAGGDKTGRIVLLVLGLLFIAYGIWFLNTHTLQTFKNHYTPLPQTRNNPYFAASLILKQQGRQGVYVKQDEADLTLRTLWQDLENAKATTAILHHIGNAQKNDLDKMIAWVQAGGHLVVFSQDVISSQTPDDFDRYQQSENPLLIKLGIHNYADYNHSYTDSANFTDWQVYMNQVPLKLGNLVAVVSDGQYGKLSSDKFFKQYNAQPYNYNAVSPNMTDDEFEQNFAPLSVRQRAVFRQLVKDNPSYFLSDSVMVDFAFGQGRLTVLDIDRPFDNPYGGGTDTVSLPTTNHQEQPDSRLARLLAGDERYGRLYSGGVAADDNAFLLRFLTDGRQKVLFVPAFERTPLSALMKKNLPFMLFALVMIGLLALLALPRQFGRNEQILDDNDKNMLSYYNAIGDYLWASDLCNAQVAINRQRLLEKIRAVLPSIHAIKDGDTISHLIAKDCHLPPSVVFEALYGEWDNEKEFVAMSRAFARLAKCY